MQTGVSRWETIATVAATWRLHLLIWRFKLNLTKKKKKWKTKRISLIENAFQIVKIQQLNDTDSVEMLNGIRASRFPSCFWPYAKLCIFKANRKGTTGTPLRRWKAIASRTERLRPFATRSCKCKIVDYHLKRMQINSNLWEICHSGWKIRINVLIVLIDRAFVFIAGTTFKVKWIIFTIICGKQIKWLKTEFVFFFLDFQKVKLPLNEIYSCGFVEFIRWQ